MSVGFRDGESLELALRESSAVVLHGLGRVDRGEHLAELLARRLPQHRGAHGPSILARATEQLEEVAHSVGTGEVLCEEIRRIHFTTALLQLDCSVSNPLLYPEALRIDMAQPAQPLPTAYANGGGTVGPDPHWHGEAKVSEQRLVAESDPGGLENTVQLRLT